MFTSQLTDREKQAIEISVVSMLDNAIRHREATLTMTVIYHGESTTVPAEIDYTKQMLNKHGAELTHHTFGFENGQWMHHFTVML